MFDIGAMELLIIVVVAILVIGPKDMPKAMRTAGRWIGKMRRMSNHFRAGIDNMIREAELEDAENEWRERNARIMAQHPDAASRVREPENLLTGHQMEPLSGLPTQADPASAESAIARAAEVQASEEPELPLDPSTKPRGNES